MRFKALYVISLAILIVVTSTPIDINIWAILMPAVYQLVPGSIIARLWFHSIFPPPPTTMGVPNNDSQESVFSNLIGKIMMA